MRALVLLLITSMAGMLTACSDRDNVSDPDLAAELELAIFSGIEPKVPELSELEIHRPEESKPAGTAPSASVEDASAMREPEGAELLGEPVVEVAAAAPEAVASSPADDVDVEPIAVATDDDDADAGDLEVPRPDVGERIIVIRGGVSGRDPCKLHRPGTGRIAGAPRGRGPDQVLGTPGVMINDRAPRIPSGRGRLPSSGPSNPGFGGAGGVFAGGIR